MEEVRNYFCILPRILKFLQEKAEKFKAGSVSDKLHNWKNVTKNKEVLNMISEGITFEFETEPVKKKLCRKYRFSEEEKRKMDYEIEEMEKQNIIVKCIKTEDDFISPIFSRPKKERVRIILNLKELNENIEYEHFKQETLKTALTIIMKNDKFASLDLKSAYYSIPVHKEFLKFLKFEWNDSLYCYTVCPNGLACCPKKFTKIMREIMIKLHKKGFRATFFLDDTLIIGETDSVCIQNIVNASILFDNLGFVIHHEKSVFTPSCSIQYLGFVIDSTKMKVTLTEERKEKLITQVKYVKKQKMLTIRELASIIGLCVAAFPAVLFGPLYYRNMEKDKVLNLRKNRGNFEKKMKLAKTSIVELEWWENNVQDAFGLVDNSHGNPDLTIFTDASKEAWGVFCDLGKTNGGWSLSEKDLSINALELKAILYGIRALIMHSNIILRHLRVMTDNTTAVHCINNMGTSHSDHCNDIAFEIWKCCREMGTWISAAHVPGKHNIEADFLSRNINMDAEWMLNPTLFEESLKLLNCKPTVDLFASRLNTQLKDYVSFYPDPFALAIDCFRMDWSSIKYFHAFPPFSMIARVLQKVKRDLAEGILVVPDWPSQPWFPVLVEYLIARPIKIAARENLLIMPNNPLERHRLHKKMSLLVCLISGQDWKVKDFQKMLQKSFLLPGEKELGKCMNHIFEDGKFMQTRKICIPYRLL